MSASLFFMLLAIWSATGNEMYSYETKLACAAVSSAFVGAAAIIFILEQLSHWGLIK